MFTVWCCHHSHGEGNTACLHRVLSAAYHGEGDGLLTSLCFWHPKRHGEDHGPMGCRAALHLRPDLDRAPADDSYTRVPKRLQRPLPQKKGRGRFDFIKGRAFPMSMTGLGGMRRYDPQPSLMRGRVCEERPTTVA